MEPPMQGWTQANTYDYLPEGTPCFAKYKESNSAKWDFYPKGYSQGFQVPESISVYTEHPLPSRWAPENTYIAVHGFRGKALDTPTVGIRDGSTVRTLERLPNGQFSAYTGDITAWVRADIRVEWDEE